MDFTNTNDVITAAKKKQEKTVLSVLFQGLAIWDFVLIAKILSSGLRPRFSALRASFGSLFQQSSFSPMHSGLDKH